MDQPVNASKQSKTKKTRPGQSGLISLSNINSIKEDSFNHIPVLPPFHSSYAAFTPNGDNLISSSLSSCIRIWNYHTSRCIKTYTGHVNVKYNCPALVIDPRGDSPRPAPGLGRDDSGHELGNVTGGEIEGAEQTGQSESEQIPDAWIVSGSDTREVCIWDGQSKALLQRIEGHSGESRTPNPLAVPVSSHHLLI